MSRTRHRAAPTLRRWLAAGLWLTAAAPAQTASAVPAAPAAAAARTESVTIPSEAADADVPAVVYLPAGYDADAARRYPVLYFLHGAGRGSERTWGERGTDRTVERMVAAGTLPPCIVVCPREPRRGSFWIDWQGHEDRRHGVFVTSELPAWVDAHYRTVADRRLRGLIGDSMGGFGAIVNALRHPEVFGSVSAHEPALFVEDLDALPDYLKGGSSRRAGILSQLFGDPVDQDWWLAHNAFHIARTAEPGAFADLAIYFDVGDADRYGFDRSCQAWHELLDKQGIAHEFHLREGAHGREFFADNVEHSLAMHGRVFAAALAERDAAGGEGAAAEKATPPPSGAGKKDGVAPR